MKIACFTALRKLEVTETPTPQLQRPDEVLVHIQRVGVCGSDVHYYTHGRIGDQIVKYPATVGHECAGSVVEVGSAVQGLHAGDPVAIEPAFSCGQCDQCRAGRENTCRKLQFMGSPGEQPGAVAEYRVLPAPNCLPVPADLDLDLATLVEPLAIGLHAVHLAAPRPGAKMAILGSGPIGLSVLLCARGLGPVTAYVSDLLDCRLEAARQCGAQWTGNPRHDDVVREIAAREPLGLDIVFECSGDPACIDQAISLLGPGGTLLLVGIPAVQRVEFDVHVMRRKELTFKSVRRQRGCAAPVIEMIASGQIDPRPLVTHHFPLARIQDAFELVAGYGDGVIKAMVVL
jgi:L-iditol 2-dehydrogenase